MFVQFIYRGKTLLKFYVTVMILHNLHDLNRLINARSSDALQHFYLKYETLVYLLNIWILFAWMNIQWMWPISNWRFYQLKSMEKVCCFSLQICLKLTLILGQVDNSYHICWSFFRLIYFYLSLAEKIHSLCLSFRRKCSTHQNINLFRFFFYCRTWL